MAEPDPSLLCPDCPKAGNARRVFPSAEARAIHRRRVHGVALPPEVRRAIEDRGGPLTPVLAPDAVRVPASAVGLPWIRYPRDAKVCDAIVERIDSVVGRATSEAERLFWDSVRDVVATIVDRARV